MFYLTSAAATGEGEDGTTCLQSDAATTMMCCLLVGSKYKNLVEK